MEGRFLFSNEEEMENRKKELLDLVERTLDQDWELYSINQLKKFSPKKKKNGNKKTKRRD